MLIPNIKVNCNFESSIYNKLLGSSTWILFFHSTQSRNIFLQ